jgi:hypothetical protein
MRIEQLNMGFIEYIRCLKLYKKSTLSSLHDRQGFFSIAYEFFVKKKT